MHPDPQTPVSPRRSGIQLVLLVIGVSFVSIAAIVFLTVAFVMFDLTIKAIITASVTAGVIALASWLRRGTLTSSAEGVAVVGGVLLLLDVWAIRSLNIFGLGQVDGTLFWGVGLVAVTTILLGWGKFADLRMPQLASSLTMGPGAFAIVQWIAQTILGRTLTEQSSALVALAGLSIASLLAPNLYRDHNRSHRLEIGIVFGIGQLASAGLALQSLANVQQPVAGAVTCAIGLFAMSGQLRRLRENASLGRLRWLRIPGTILATLLWASAVLMIAGRLAVSSDLTGVGPGDFAAQDRWQAIPFVALAIVFWDVLFIRSSHADRVRWRAGTITAVVIVSLLALSLLFGIVRLPFLRAMSTGFGEYDTNWALLLTGSGLIVGSVIAALAYRVLAQPGRAQSSAGFARRMVVASVVGVVGLSIAALALPFLPSIITLAVLMLASIVAVGILCRGQRSTLRFVLQAAFVAAAAAMVLISFLHTPFVLGTFASIGFGFLTLRLFRGTESAIPLTLATSLMGVASSFVSWAPNDYPVLSAVFTLAMPVAILLVAAGWRALNVVDRRALVWTATPLLFVAAGQQLPLALARTDAPFADTVLATLVATGIATFAHAALIATTFRAKDDTRPDALTHSLALSATLPLVYIGVSPIVQFLVGNASLPLSEILLVWVPVISSLITAAVLTLIRLKSVPGRWTMVADSLAVVAAFLSMCTIFVLSLPADFNLRPSSFIALAIAVAVPLTITVRSAGQPSRGSFRGVFPWIAAGFLALFGPFLILGYFEDPWPVMVAAPIALAFLAAGIVLRVSGMADRSARGPWVLGGMLTLGTVLPLATLLASRQASDDVQPWQFSCLTAVLSFVGLGVAAFTKSSPVLAPTRQLLLTVLAPLGTLAAITAVGDILDATAIAAQLQPAASSYLLAAVIAGSTLLTVHVMTRGLRRSATNPVASPARSFQYISLAGVVLIAFAALLIPPRAIDVTLAAWAIALVFVVLSARLTAHHSIPARTQTAPDVQAFVYRALVAVAQVIAAGSTLLATLTGQHIDSASVAIGVTIVGVVVAILMTADELRGSRVLEDSRRTSPRSLPLRVLSLILVPIAVWAALIAVPVAWPWWMLLAAAAVAVSGSVAAAVWQGLTRRPLGGHSLSAAGAAAVLPLVSAPFITEESVRVWPFTWLVVGTSLVALGFAVNGVLAVIARGSGTATALISSALLLWPDNPDATVLLVAAPGCALLAVMAFIAAMTSKAARSTSTLLESGVYAGAVPLWFAGLTAAAMSAIPEHYFVIAMLAMLCTGVAANSLAALTHSNRPAIRLPMLMITVGSGVSAVIMLIASRRIEADVPADVYFLSFGLAMTAIGAPWLRIRPTWRSLPVLGPGLLVTLLPLWIIEAANPTPTRIGIYTALALAAMLIGALRRLQAPLVVGSAAAIAHLIVAIRWMLPELSVPWWVWLGSAGALLIFVAATYEARLRDAKTVARSIAQLR